MTIDDIEAHRLDGFPIGECYEALLAYARQLEAQLTVVPDERLIEIYDLYPRKAARPAALKAIRSALKKVPFDALRSHVLAYAKWHKEMGMEMQYTPMPATWFNQERWNDTPVAPVCDGQKFDRIKSLRDAISTSPAFPGGRFFVDHTMVETREALKRNIDELMRLSPNENLNLLKGPK